MRVAILFPATRVHREGCADINRDLRTRQDCEFADVIEASSLSEVAADAYQDHLMSDPDLTVEECVDYLDVAPCVGLR
jgi:hypothetical protein